MWSPMRRHRHDEPASPETKSNVAPVWRRETHVISMILDAAHLIHTQ